MQQSPEVNTDPFDLSTIVPMPPTLTSSAWRRKFLPLHELSVLLKRSLKKHCYPFQNSFLLGFPGFWFSKTPGLVSPDEQLFREDKAFVIPCIRRF